ncbi:SPOSA6832_03442 [Sporobolomyces salmonicolor]|uniref:SPOSA6832_03442-mRNA-1:cds n=1 Tax=Sporidiobolus salmonicolor TaxID=5005 RepID=A0A0D6EP58_SPOSA|nr:SPOSA6832_03442 [Sporobolomyces salmonicolor]
MPVRSSASTQLPPELLYDILSTSSKRTLRATSLVHSSWRGPSQALLETDLSLTSRRVAKSWLQIKGRKCKTRRLSLPVGLDTEDCWEVFESVEGLKELSLVAQEGAAGKSKFEGEVLECSRLKDIAMLHLAAPFSEPIYPSTNYTFPFSLSSLSCKGLFNAYPSAFIASLVASSLTTLVALDLDTYGSHSSASTFFAALLPVAPTLKHLKLHGSDRQVSPLLTFLTGCTSLESFTCWDATLPLLSSLPPSLRTLTIGKNYTFHSDMLYDELLTRSGLLEQLRTIRWAGISKATLKAQRGGGELLQECEERGIAVQFGVESVGDWFGYSMFGIGR